MRTAAIAGVIAFLPLLPGIVHADAIVSQPDGLVSWWSGNGTSQDVAGSNDGTLQNGTGFSPGVIGDGFSFDGVDDYVFVNDDASLNFGANQDFTLEGWINLQNSVAGADDWIASKWDVQNYRSGTTTNLFGLYLNRDDHEIRFDIHSNGAFGSVSGPELLVNEWVHVAAMRSGAEGIIYVNGLEVTRGVVPAGDLGNADPFILGGVYDTQGPSVQVNHGFGGFIDEFKIYNRALTGSEVNSIYRGSPITPAVPEPSSLVLLGLGIMITAGMAAYNRKTRNQSR